MDCTLPPGWDWYELKLMADAVPPHPATGAMHGAGLALLLAAPTAAAAAARGPALLRALGWAAGPGTPQLLRHPPAAAAPPPPDSGEYAAMLLDHYLAARLRRAWRQGFDLLVVPREEVRDLLGPLADQPHP